MSLETMKNTEYWEERAARSVEAGEKSAIKTARELARVFEDAQKQIQKEVEAFYARYSIETGASLVDIKAKLNPAQLLSAREDIARYYAEIERLGGYSQAYKTFLRSLSARAYMSRLEELQLQIRRDIENAYRQINEEFTEGLSDVYEDGYYHAVFDMAQGVGVQPEFTALNKRIVNKAIKQNWLGANYSDRLWDHKDQLLNSLNTTFLRGVALGWNANKIGRTMANDVMTSYDRSTVRNCVRLAHTEFIRVANQATLDGYKEYGVVKQYKWLASLDERICPICGQLDGEIFDADEASEGVNAPPIHPRCRCCTVAFFPPTEADKMFEKAKRAARDPETGKTYYVDVDITFSEWFSGLTKTQKGEFKYIREKSVTNELDDGIINTGGMSGALNPDSARAQEHADRFYESVRKRIGDAERIAEHTGLSTSDVKLIKDHVFVKEHDFADGRRERFYPSYHQAQAWQRLESGGHTQDDIVFLRHELAELRYMKAGDVYETAHNKANAEYNWQALIDQK